MSEYTLPIILFTALVPIMGALLTFLFVLIDDAIYRWRLRRQAHKWLKP
ncbi:MAG: hypothetical protein K9L88_10330 [Chromatiaceae bacterium]|nr:hypothetical protein [Chromatiaceae bacterium]